MNKTFSILTFSILICLLFVGTGFAYDVNESTGFSGWTHASDTFSHAYEVQFVNTNSSETVRLTGINNATDILYTWEILNSSHHIIAGGIFPIVNWTLPHNDNSTYYVVTGRNSVDMDSYPMSYILSASYPINQDHVKYLQSIANIEVANSTDIGALATGIFIREGTNARNVVSLQFTVDAIACTPNWNCSSYNTCNVNNVSVCTGVEDTNVCGDTFAGNLSDYNNNSCSYVPPTPSDNSWWNFWKGIFALVFLLVTFWRVNFILENVSDKEYKKAIIEGMLILIIGVTLFLAIL